MLSYVTLLRMDLDPRAVPSNLNYVQPFLFLKFFSPKPIFPSCQNQANCLLDWLKSWSHSDLWQEPIHFAMSGSAWSNVMFLIRETHICVLQ